MDSPATFCDYRNDFDTGALICVPHSTTYPCPHDREASPVRPVDRDPKEHVIRAAPPWRALNPAAAPASECGRTIGPRTRTITREQVLDRLTDVRRMNEKFNALPLETRREQFPAARKRFQAARDEALKGVCSVCREKMNHYRPWEAEPAALIVREYERTSAGHRELLDRELHALAALVAAHPAEFSALLDGDVTALTSRRKRA